MFPKTYPYPPFQPAQLGQAFAEIAPPPLVDVPVLAEPQRPEVLELDLFLFVCLLGYRFHMFVSFVLLLCSKCMFTCLIVFV